MPRLYHIHDLGWRRFVYFPVWYKSGLPFKHGGNHQIETEATAFEGFRKYSGRATIATLKDLFDPSIGLNHYGAKTLEEINNAFGDYKPWHRKARHCSSRHSHSCWFKQDKMHGGPQRMNCSHSARVSVGGKVERSEGRNSQLWITCWNGTLILVAPAPFGEEGRPRCQRNDFLRWYSERARKHIENKLHRCATDSPASWYLAASSAAIARGTSTQVRRHISSEEVSSSNSVRNSWFFQFNWFNSVGSPAWQHGSSFIV